VSLSLILSLILALALSAGAARAQGSAPPAGGNSGSTSGATGSPAAGSVAPGTASASAPETAPSRRAAWLGDTRPLRVGDLLTVVVDEQTTSEEKVSRTATAARSKDASLNATADGKSAVGNTGVRSALNGTSRDVGQAGRSGGLTGTITVRVQALDEKGIAQISGTKEVTLDGRRQEMTLSGFVRPEDVGPTNVVFSSRVGEAKITYQGKQIGPKGGILGRILSMLWP
jgi:flagellar L-ring protein precursor FlgH